MTFERSRYPRSVRARTILYVATLAACSVHFPDELGFGPTPANPANGPGLDARPPAPGCSGAPLPPEAEPKIGFEEASPVAFEQPVEVAVHGGRVYVLERGGLLRVLSADRSTATVVADLTSKVTTAGEAGLLGIAFHPSFATNGFVYVYVTAPKTAPGVVFESVILRYTSTDGGLTLDLSTEKRIFAVDQPYSNHNGGTIAFGNDGYLYFALGDGGGPPEMRPQDKNTVLGKIVRIDVDGGDPYAIPPTNPFVGDVGREEIWALGFRNPFRFRFDRVTGDLWLGDVGAGAREEIDKVVAGGNYGWPLKEGRICYNDPCDPAFIEPIVDHVRAEAITITGGVVYRGTALPALTGKYVYGDFGTQTFWAIPTNEPAPKPELLEDRRGESFTPTSFEIDVDGEILFTSFSMGRLFRIVKPGPPPEVPRLLSRTGCVDSEAPRKPAAGLVPYDVAVPQWMDGARAKRFVAVPDGATIGVETGGRLVLPPGAVAVRTLDNGTRPLETQLLRRRPDGSWHAARYVWEIDQSDAVLADEGSLDCGVCHKANDGTTIGLEAAQLDRPSVDFGNGRLGNPLVTFEHIGLVATPVARDSYRPLPAASARGYLHANCAFCHHGGDGAAIDLRAHLPLSATNTCNKMGSLGSGGSFVLLPGRPEESQIVTSMRAAGPWRMPPAGTRVVDERGAKLVEDFVAGLTECR